MNFPGPINSNLSSASAVSLDSEHLDLIPKSHVGADGHAAGVIVVPDTQLLFSGEYSRAGNDLVLSAQNQKYVVQDYFRGEKRATLASKDGATLTGDVISALTGHVQYAQAAAPAAAEIIGHVMKMTGSASVVRNGVAIVLNVGDAVQKGDVVQTGTDSSIGLTLIDGTAFAMASNARMVLNEMVYDPNGSSNSSLISLVQGTITFVAGQTAKNGNMRVDTPVATMGIRGTAVLVEISADNGPTKFSVLLEPDGHTGSFNIYDKVSGQLIGTVTQSGQVTFVSPAGLGQVTAIEQAKTAFDLQAEKSIIQDVFKLYFPNYDSNPKSTDHPRTDIGVPQNTITKYGIDDAGRPTVTVTTTYFNPDTNTTTTTQKIAVNTAPTFSVANVLDGQNPSSSLGFKLGDRVTITDPDINQAPFLDVPIPYKAGSGQLASVTGTGVSFLPGSYFAITATGDGATHPVATSALPWFISLDIATGQVTYNPTNFAFLNDNETLIYTFSFVAASGVGSTGSDSAGLTLTLSITGHNDAPVFATGVDAPVHEVGDLSVPGSDTGTSKAVSVAFTDADFSDIGANYHVVLSDAKVSATSDAGATAGLTQAGAAALTAELKSFLNLSATATKALNDTNGHIDGTFSADDRIFDYLADGQKLVIVYTATVTDPKGAVVPVDFTVTVIGTNDIPTITTGEATQSATIFEIPGQINDSGFDETTGGVTPSGSIHFADVDLTDLPTPSLTDQTVTYTPNVVGAVLTPTQIATIKQAFAFAVPIGSGSNTNNGVVDWTYKIQDDALDFLANNEVITLVNTVEIADGHGGVATATVTINIVGGSNDDAVISVVSAHNDHDTGAVTEDAHALAETATGTLSFVDVDLTDSHTVSRVDPVGSVLGTLIATVTTDTASGVGGVVTWNYSVDDSAIQYLAAGQTKDETFTISLYDGTSTVTKNVTVTITGTNDVPVFSVENLTGSGINETNGTPNPAAPPLADSGILAFDDVDLSDTHSVSATGTFVPKFIGDVALGSLTTVKDSDTSDGVGGQITWNYHVDAAKVEYLAAGQTLIESFTITIGDGTTGGAPITKTINVTITGTNDEPVFAGDHAGAVTETIGTPADTTPLTDSGIITFTDVDLSDTHSVSATGAFQPPQPGDVALGSLTVAKDSDTSNGSGGQFTWTYSIDPTKIEYLAAGETVTEHFIVTIGDGGSTGTPVEQQIDVVVTGTNDAPVITADVSGTDAGGTPTLDNVHGLTETNAGLRTTGTLDVTDVDLTNSVTASVQSLDVQGDGVAGRPSSLTDAVLLDMLSIGDPNVIDNTSTTGTIHWTFDSDTQAFDFLAAGETLELHYIIRATDTNTTVPSDTTHATGDTEIVITVTGTNDAPVVAALLTASANEGDSVTTLDLLAGATDVDHGETATLAVVAASVMYAVDGGTASATAPAGLSLTGATLSLDPTNPAFDHLAADETQAIVVSYNVTDVHGVTVAQSETITIAGTNDAPTLAHVDAGTINDTVAYDSFDHLTGSLTSAAADPDDGETATLTYGAVDGSNHVVNTAIVGTYGALTVGSDGSYSYTPDSAAINALASGAHIDTFTIATSDGSITTTSTLTVNINGADDAPVISTAGVQIVNHPNGTSTISGLSVSDVDSSTGQFTISGVTDGHGTISPSSGTDTLTAVNSALAPTRRVVVYTPTDTSATGKVTMTVADDQNVTDTVNFIFKQAGTAGVTLTGTTDKDVLIGGQGADNFVFAANSNKDVILGFQTGVDKIDLTALNITDSNLSWFTAHSEAVTGGTLVHLDVTTGFGGPADHDTILIKVVVAANDFILHTGGA